MRYVGEVGPLKTNVRITCRNITGCTYSYDNYGYQNGILVEWEPSGLFTGYQLEYQLYENDPNIITIGNKTTKSYVIKVYEGGTYHIRVRSYHIFNGTTYYGGWSDEMTMYY